MQQFISTLNTFFADILAVLTGVVVAGAAICIAWAGWAYMTSEGNPRRVDQARSMATYAVAGLIIVLLADAIASAVEGAIA